MSNNDDKPPLTCYVPVWDWAVRLFHLALILAVAGLWYTVEFGTGLDFPMEWHARLGYCVLGLVVFRLIWGVIGAGHARFASFMVSPVNAWRYGSAFLAKRQPRYAGHNPLGGWMVAALLWTLLVQAISGLFATDDILFDGPLREWGTPALLTAFNWLHHNNITVLWGLITIHLLAVMWHALRGERLIAAMLTGKKPFTSVQDVHDVGRGYQRRMPMVPLLLAVFMIGVVGGVIWLTR
ncbi:cytochrome b/b6 domain-containing protein [Cobetia crustatorum]|uniref:Cytochrome B n=1 Tax=Cobetia crustatorum TaxID=553385 RepID=A0A558HKY4_9GAMM|nr:cytochrome b/b6 domain-containing protein [Cobetia crustatorum]TVU69728.1 cytochrome B [Cobetia crustatorum]